jgi:glyoxylase-like metal-dependent hydrolase (beta-lactamase superfamily II)
LRAADLACNSSVARLVIPALAEAIKANGKKLTTVYISQSDPDYYFSLAPIKAAFPAAKVIAASATLAAIKGDVEKKLATWGPQLKENGPQAMADIVMPMPSTAGPLPWKARPSRSPMPMVLPTGRPRGD